MLIHVQLYVFLSLSLSLCSSAFTILSTQYILFLLFIRPVPAGKLYSIDPLLGRFGGLVLSTLAAVCSSDSER